MGITAFPFSSVIDVPTARILGRDDAGTGAAEALTNTEIFAILGTGTPSASTYLRGDGTWSTVSAGVGGSTGSVDNAVLRADGTGGATLQASAVVIPDNYTASPNATVNHASIQATGDTTNVSVSVVPKGTGSFTMQVPDGATTGGNARGINSVDFQRTRNSATQVASGENTFLGPGVNGTASGDRSVSFNGGQATGNDSFAWRGTAGGAGAIALAQSSNASGSNSIAAAFAAEATATFAVSVGVGTTASGEGSFGCGREANARLYGSFAFATKGDVSGRGNKQMVMMLLRASTSGTTPAELFATGSAERLTIPSGKVCQFFIMVSGSKNDGSAVATYCRLYALKNVGGTTSEVFAPQTLGTDTAASTSIALTADNTNDSLKIECTGITGETWRWQAFIFWSEYIWTA